MSKTGCSSTTVPSICIPSWAGGTVAIVVVACDPGRQPPGLAPRSTRTKKGGQHTVEQRHLFATVICDADDPRSVNTA